MELEKEILDVYKVIAIVGLSANIERPSNRVGTYLKDRGYKIIPVNPVENEILGEKCYPDLFAIRQPIDVVDIFRKSEDVLPIVEDAIKVGAKVIWMQEGVVNEQAAKIARDKGLKVVMGKCMRKEHIRLFTKSKF